ncbi:MAG: tRNA (cytidine(34)-2'-O)-methyltransferase [Deltaproteobacteria bacterium]|nr:MAG: tRNA (cytidine(34)-2'-O)-methyltransferase [Deltaproteobacteria bacterium]
MNDAPLHIVLVEPEIPPNTGNVARLCAATGIVLHLVEPLGFSIDDRHLKRAGLDYWPAVRLKLWQSFGQLRHAHPDARFWYTSKTAKKCYTEANFRKGDFLVFGKETVGLPKELLEGEADRCLRIPIPTGKVRSLNMSTAVGIVAYEALRQTGQLA